MKSPARPFQIVFRCDAARHIGTGHVMRGLTLAQEFRKRGSEVTFITRPFEGNLDHRILEAGYRLRSLPSVPTPQQAIVDKDYHLWFGVDPTTDAAESAKLLPNETDLLVVDHYAINDGWERVLRPKVKTILAVDDLANRRHDADLLLDQNYVPAHEAVYRRLLPSEAELLGGPKFALLRPEFRMAHERATVRQQVKKILVFFGGIDAAGETTKVVRALVPLLTPELSIDVIIGTGYAAKKELAALIDRTPGVMLHEQVSTMADFMLKADLAIGAGGTTTWERCAAGLPAVIVSIAENQRDIAMGADELGVVEYLGHATEISATGYQEAIRPLLGNTNRIRQMSERARTLVDGNGTTRVVDAALAMIYKRAVSAATA